MDLKAAEYTVTEDDDGNPIVTPPPNADVVALVYLLTWARASGFRVGPTIRVGSLVLQVQDLRQARKEGRGEPLPPDSGPWKDAGYDGPD